MSDLIEFPGGTLWAVLEHYGWDLPAPRSGWHTLKCQAHPDSRASLRVNDDIGAVACQACSFSGDIIKVIQHLEGGNVDFREALRIAEQITGDLQSVPRSVRKKVTSSRAYVPPRLRKAGA